MSGDVSSDVEAKTMRKLKMVIRDEFMYRQLLQSRGPDAQALLNMFQKVSSWTIAGLTRIEKV
ncbi:hypothetical protein C0995_006055 [Termitomyces sp. Mi166|nr:hypothetical protein C0995_006055 [Termitomyces sp. Mi166\